MKKGSVLKFALFDSLFWGFFAAFNGFITTYFLECGMPKTQLSILLAVHMACSFLGSFVWGGLCDRIHENRKVFLWAFAPMIIIALLDYYIADKLLWIAALLYPLFGFVCLPMGSCIDAWMLRSFNHDGNMYGRARGIGSMGYAIAALIVGNFIKVRGYTVIPIATMIIGCLVYFMAFITADHPYTVTKTAEKGNPKELLKIKPYMILLIILFLNGLAASPVNNLKTVVLQSVGGDVGSLGFDSFLGVLIQACLIFVSGKLLRIPKYTRLLMMALCTMIMMLLVIFAVNPVMVIASTVMYNMGYGLLLPTQREITEESVPQNLKTTAHSLCDTMSSSFSGMLALLYSGAMMDAFGVRSVAVLGLVVIVIAVLLSLYAIKRERYDQSSIL